MQVPIFVWKCGNAFWKGFDISGHQLVINTCKIVARYVARAEERKPTVDFTCNACHHVVTIIEQLKTVAFRHQQYIDCFLCLLILIGVPDCRNSLSQLDLQGKPLPPGGASCTTSLLM